MKKLIIILSVIAVLLIAGCTKVITYPNVDGNWTVNAVIEGAVYCFDMEIAANGCTFDATATGFEISGGGTSYSGLVTFNLAIDGRLYAFHGNASNTFMSGFLRKGIQGGIVGNWSASR